MTFIMIHAQKDNLKNVAFLATLVAYLATLGHIILDISFLFSEYRRRILGLL